MRPHDYGFITTENSESQKVDKHITYKLYCIYE